MICAIKEMYGPLRPLIGVAWLVWTRGVSLRTGPIGQSCRMSQGSREGTWSLLGRRRKRLAIFEKLKEDPSLTTGPVSIIP